MNEHTENKTESFASRHVRTITFLVCIGIFLALCGPISIFTVKNWIANAGKSERTMTSDELIRLMKDPSSYMNLEYLQKYRGTRTAGDFSDSYYIEFEDFLLLVVQNRETTAVETCLVTNMKTGETLNLKKVNVNEQLEQFLKDPEGWKGTAEIT